MRLFLVFCLRRRWLTHNVAKDIDPPKGVKPKEVIPYTEAEVAHIVAACAEIGKQPLRALPIPGHGFAHAVHGVTYF